MRETSTDYCRISAQNHTSRKLIIVTGFFILALALVLAPGAGSSARAGTAGAFAKTLKNTFCGGTSGAQWYGCYAYMHYRVDLVKSRDSAKSICYRNGCGSKYGSGPSYDTCKTGCDKAYGADTN